MLYDDIIKLIQKQSYVDVEDILNNNPNILNEGTNKLGLASEKTPLIFASELGDLKMVKLLVKHGAKVNTRVSSRQYTALQRAIYSESFPVAKFLLDNGAKKDIDYQQPSTGRTALCLATSNNIEDITELLLRYGADVNITDNLGYFPLMELLRSRDFKNYKYLLKLGKQEVKLMTEGPKNLYSFFENHNRKFKELADKYLVDKVKRDRIGVFADLLD